MTKSSTANPEAYQDYLKGRYWWNKKTEEGLNKGIEYFQQAIAKDPTYALAYAGLADCYTMLANFGFVPPNKAYPKAKEAALKALETDDSVAEAHTSLGFIKMAYDWDWTGGEREFQRAIELNPSSVTAHQLYGLALAAEGRFEEAIKELKRALELDPLSPSNNSALGTGFLCAQQYDQAIEQERKALDLDANFLPAHLFLGWSYVQKSMYKEGIAELEKAMAISPGNTLLLSGLGYAYAAAGRKLEAQKVLDQLNDLAKQKYVPAMYRAWTYAGLGEKDKAFEWLEKGYEDRSILSIKAYGVLAPLHSDPRWIDLLRRMNLQP